MSAETDDLFEHHRTHLAKAESFAARYAERVVHLQEANRRRARPKTGSDLELIVYSDEYVRTHRADEQHHRAWAVAYAAAYQAARMREIELTLAPPLAGDP